LTEVGAYPQPYTPTGYSGDGGTACRTGAWRERRNQAPARESRPGFAAIAGASSPMAARVTVHETARIMSLGHGGDVLLSDIAKDLAKGASDEYEDRGVHNLKGMPRPRHVFAVA
jgi:hypothetical protein